MYECKTYGENTTLAELLKEIQGNKIHKCPKCSGTGKITKKRNKAQYWECCDDYEYYDVECDLCNGQGYTEHMYKVYTTDVAVEEHEIAQSRSEASNQQDSNRQPEISPYGKDKDNGFMNIPDGIDDELPFS